MSEIDRNCYNCSFSMNMCRKCSSPNNCLECNNDEFLLFD